MHGSFVKRHKQIVWSALLQVVALFRQPESWLPLFHYINRPFALVPSTRTPNFSHLSFTSLESQSIYLSVFPCFVRDVNDGHLKRRPLI